jgi:cystathionine beta-lyase/cystathionine gamma-synthase
MTHASVPRETRLAMGFADGLLRLSVGIEDLADLRQDLAAALEAYESLPLAVPARGQKTSLTTP